MNNRKRLAEKIRRLQLNEIIAMQKTASALGEKRAYAEELDVRKKLVVKAKQYYGEDALETLDAMSDLAFSFQDLYHFDEAFAIRKDSLEKCKELFGEHHRATAMAMYFMANTLNAMGRYQEALSYDYETYMDRLGLLGTRDIDTIRAATNLAASYADIGDYKTSLFYLKKAQEYVAEIYDKDSDEIVKKSLDITARTATILGDMEEYEEALHLYDKVENEYEKRFGLCHENTLMIIRRLSLTLSHLGKHEQAKSNLTTLLVLEKMIFGADDYETLWTMTGLGCVLDELGEYEESKKLHEHVLNKKRAFYGEKHPAYIMALSNWAYACHRSSDTNQGSMCIRPLEQALTDDLIENAEDKICITDVLVHLYIDIGEYEKAAGLSSQMIDSAEYHYFYKKKFLAEKYDTAKLAFEKAGNLEKAREYEYKKTHMDELIYSGKPLCGMKLKAKEEDGISLTKGKVYELLGTEKVGGSLLYSIIDDEEFGPYLYGPGEFEVVE
jgi:tetratricopeptide (TPR) repeat protein